MAVPPITITATKVTPRLYFVEGLPGVASVANRGFNSNAGFVVTDEGVVVVDALGTEPLGAALVDAIRKVTTRPIRRVIVTHYHADHFYGLGPLKAAGAEVWAHHLGREYLETQGGARLAQRRQDLAPWVDERTRLVPADRWLAGDTTFAMGGVDFDVVHMGPAHAPDDVIVVVRQEQAIFCGDIMISGRVPFVGEADSKRWLVTLDRLLALRPRLMVPGHGGVSRDPARDLAFTRDYLLYLRKTMGRAVADLVPFDEAYAATDWSRYAAVPAFDAANRINAYGTYLLMERESLGR
ncbi:MAG TPA: MBL fold metallo-hydrolase [Methylomirabilota bacterium]|nr:MBL fold metallo-hydrolase [Methylomirabilota bacterium]